MLQQRTAHGHRFRPDYTERRPADDRHIPLAASTLLLVREQIVSPWRPLLWFWGSVLCVVVVGAMALELLGPPPERLLRDAMLAEEGQPAPAALPGPAPERSTASSAQPQPQPSAQQPQAVAAAPSQAPDTAARQAPPGAVRVAMVLHPPPSADGVAIASRLASLAGLDSNQVEVGSAGDVKTAAVIRFYAASDHPLARRLGKELRKMGYAWRIENFSERSWAWKDQAVEVWLPVK